MRRWKRRIGNRYVLLKLDGVSAGSAHRASHDLKAGPAGAVQTVRPNARHSYSYPIRKLTRPSGNRRMSVMFTGRPPPLGERLDGIVSGVNELFAGLG